MRVANNRRQPHTLDGGTILAAADTKGSVKTVENLSEADRAAAARGLISILPESAVQGESASASRVAAPPAPVSEISRKKETK